MSDLSKNASRHDDPPMDQDVSGTNRFREATSHIKAVEIDVIGRLGGKLRMTEWRM
jgi:hypothetical protein